MQTKKLTVLTEGGEVFGFGHITRCLSICKYFKESEVYNEFIIDGDDSIMPLLEKQSFVLMKWLNKKSLLKQLYESSFILIDSLRIKNCQIKDIQKLDASIIYIDDDKRQKTQVQKSKQPQQHKTTDDDKRQKTEQKPRHNNQNNKRENNNPNQHRGKDGNKDTRNRYRQPDFEFDGIIESEGVLDIMQDGYGFLRSSDYNYLSSPDDLSLIPL